MNLKSFDDFCAKVVNNEPIENKAIFDERQSMVRSRITIKALWIFIITAGINILVMECGPQWCESWVLSTAIFGAAAYLYWVCANARHGTLFGVNGTNPIAWQAAMLVSDGVLIPVMMCMDKDSVDVFTAFFIRNGMVSEYLAAAISGVLLAISAIVMIVNIKAQKNKKDN